jgi:endoplasmic reticulum chaperone BiP
MFHCYRRFIGRKFSASDFCPRVRGLYTIRGRDAAGKSTCAVDFEGRQQKLTVEEITAHLVRKLKQNAEAFLGQEVRHALVTVPADFKDEQRQGMKDACALAGLKVLRVVNEPVAAAMAYELEMVSAVPCLQPCEEHSERWDDKSALGGAINSKRLTTSLSRSPTSVSS